MLNVVARPVPGDANKTNATIYMQMDVGLPSFMANFALRNMLPRITSRVRNGYAKVREEPDLELFKKFFNSRNLG